MKSPARTRILETATRLFYAEGVRAVGIDRIIAEAAVAKATFYHHFPAKDDLVCAYVEDQSRLHQTITAQLAADTPRDTLLAVFDLLGEAGRRPDYRGCPFVNAAAEYPDNAHPVRQAVARHREWFRGLLLDLLKAAGDPAPERTADILVVLRDGLAVGCDLDDPAILQPMIRDSVTRILDRAPGS